MSDANFTPNLGEYKSLQPFRFWCQKVLPLVYDDSLSYYELLCKVVDYLNKTMEDVETLHGDVTNLHKAYVELQGYVNNYFNNLDVQSEINNRLDSMASDGTLLNIIRPTIINTTDAWLHDNITNPSSPPIDTSLSISGAAADAKTTGDSLFKKLQFIGVVNENTLNIYLPNGDANNAENNGYYLMYGVQSISNIPPTIDKAFFMLECFGEYGDKTIKVQRITDFQRNSYIRYLLSGSWSNWVSVTGFNFIGVGDFANNLNNAPLNSYYITYNLTSSPINSPDNAKNYCLMTLGGTNFVYQIYISNKLFTRFNYGGTWSDWSVDSFAIIVDKNIQKTAFTFPTLKEGIEAGNSRFNSIVYVNSGTYDLVEEFGTEFLENMNESSPQGLYLNNNITVIFQPNSKITFNYTGNNDFVKTNFSPFNTNNTKYGFTLIGCNIEASNCRYCVHDEHTTNTEPYVNNYIDCDFKIDNTKNTVWGLHQCIGGGLGVSGIVKIENCIFNVLGATENIYAVSYHNCALENAKSFITITGCLFEHHNGIGFTEYGVSTLVSKMIASNNAFKDETPFIEEIKGSTNNVKLIKFNNVGSVDF